jgi:hypothetical protein
VAPWVPSSFIPAGGTIPYAKNQRLPTSSQRASARLVGIPSLQRSQSLVRERSASPDHWISFCQHDYFRGGAAGLCSLCGWQSVCFVFCRSHQRDEAKHSGHKQYAVAGHAHYCRDRRSRNRQCDGRHSQRQLGGFGLQQRGHQWRARPDDNLAGRHPQRSRALRTSWSSPKHPSEPKVLLGLAGLNGASTWGRRKPFEKI